uniref:ApeA_NTD1 domain-containing protein n=1 Tax=Caenorhabditis tropicalis TaxID=1561998 RepID=A0A1I7TJW4_9PELO
MNNFIGYICSFFSPPPNNLDQIKRNFEGGISTLKPHPTRENQFVKCEGTIESLEQEVSEVVDMLPELLYAVRFEDKYERLRKTFISRLLVARAEYYTLKKFATHRFEILELKHEKILEAYNFLSTYEHLAARMADYKNFEKLVYGMKNGMYELKAVTELFTTNEPFIAMKLEPTPTILGKYLHYPGSLLTISKDLVVFDEILTEMQLVMNANTSFKPDLLKRLKPSVHRIDSQFCEFYGVSPDRLVEQEKQAIVFMRIRDFMADIIEWNEVIKDSEMDSSRLKESILNHIEYHRIAVRIRMEFRTKFMNLFGEYGGRIVDIEEAIQPLRQLLDNVRYGAIPPPSLDNDFKNLDHCIRKVIINYQMFFIARNWEWMRHENSLETKAKFAYRMVINIKLLVDKMKKDEFMERESHRQSICTYLDNHTDMLGVLKRSRNGFMHGGTRHNVWSD